MATLTTLVNFNGANGNASSGGLTIDATGDLFGTTALGGANNDGTVFEIVDTNGSYASKPTTIATFDGGNGDVPEGGLVLDRFGDVFGTTDLGGGADGGTVYELVNSSSGYESPITLFGFDATDGSVLEGGLAFDTLGDIFGTTTNGGANNDGTVFILYAAGGGGSLINFNGSDGKSPSGNLVGDANGDIFGTTISGGTNNDGTVYEVLNSSAGYANIPTTLAAFNGTNGQGPVGGLVADAAGDLFGETEAGGASGDGTVFELINNNGTYSGPVTLVSFNSTDGATPQGGLIIDADGNLYGTASAGGANNDGTVFEIVNTSSGYANTPVTLETFNGTNNGSDPINGVIADASGNLYGTTYSGGTNNDGTVFEVTGTGFVAPPPAPPERLSVAAILGDFNDDGRADILFENVNVGQLFEWEMNGTSVINSGSPGNNANPAWQVVGTGDFTDNGYSDILFQNIDSGQVYEWQMNGTSVVAAGYVGNNTNPEWQVVGTGDFTDNGYSDILFQNTTTGQVDEWQMNGTTAVASALVGNNTSPAWQVVGTGDFTDNGYSDILFQNSTTGQVYEWEMNGTTVVASGLVGNNTSPAWQVVGIGDFTGSGYSDILFQNSTTGQVYEWEMNGTNVIGSGVVGNNTDPTWKVVGTGDLNGDGKADIVFQNVNSGQVFAWLMNGTSVIGSGIVGNNANPAWHVSG
jgi:uncharacterized repeat protein (TIGR03803 family)